MRGIRSPQSARRPDNKSGPSVCNWVHSLRSIRYCLPRVRLSIRSPLSSCPSNILRCPLLLSRPVGRAIARRRPSRSPPLTLGVAGIFSRSARRLIVIPSSVGNSDPTTVESLTRRTSSSAAAERVIRLYIRWKILTRRGATEIFANARLVKRATVANAH